MATEPEDKQATEAAEQSAETTTTGEAPAEGSVAQGDGGEAAAE